MAGNNIVNSMKGKKLTSKEINSIKEYSNTINTIELFADSVRLNPGEYLSSTGNEGFMNCIREIFQNSADEMSRPGSFCDSIWIYYDEITHKVTIADNGRALDPSRLLNVFAREHTSSNFVKAKGMYQSGMHGVGSKCVNAVSTRFSVWSYYLGKCYYLEFKEGKPLKSFNGKPKELPNKKGIQGLVVEFIPDPKVMGEITVTCNDVLKLVELLVPLYKLGARVVFEGTNSQNEKIIKEIVNKDALLTYLVWKTEKPMIKPIHIFNDTGVMKADIMMTYEANVSKSADVITFANMTPVDTMKSTPSRGFLKGVETFFKNYMNKIFLANSKKKITVTGSDCTTGLIAAISSAHMKIVLSGQSKEICKNEDLEIFCKDLTISALEEWSKQNPNDLQKLCVFIKDVASIRYRMDKDRNEVAKKYKTSNFIGLPKGFFKAERKDHLELFITEGDSAAGTAKTGRDTVYQAVYGIRGKIINALSKSRDKVMNNDQFKDLNIILGCGYGKNCDPDKCPYDKIIILADADPDGTHIRTMVLILFLVYFRPLVEQGRLYIGISPLYLIDRRTKKWQYFTDKSEFIEYYRNIFCKSFQIKHFSNKKPFTNSEVANLISNNEKYDRLLEHIASNKAIHPILLETILRARNLTFNKFKKAIENKYPFLTVSTTNGYTTIRGIAHDVDNLIFLNETMYNDCKVLYQFLDNSESHYVIGDKVLTLYEVMSLYRSVEPKNIERAKGLGQLNAIELSISTLRPENRKLLRYTTKDIEDTIVKMRQMNDNKFDLIKDVDISNYEF